MVKWPSPHYLLLGNVHLQTFLDNKKRGVSPQFSVWVDKLEVIIAQQSWADLVDLEQSQIPANAKMTAATKLCNICQLHSHSNLIVEVGWLVLTWNMYLSILLASSASPSHLSGR